MDATPHEVKQPKRKGITKLSSQEERWKQEELEVQKALGQDAEGNPVSNVGRNWQDPEMGPPQPEINFEFEQPSSQQKPISDQQDALTKRTIASNETMAYYFRMANQEGASLDWANKAGIDMNLNGVAINTNHIWIINNTSTKLCSHTI